jgi:hypothetical protein
MAGLRAGSGRACISIQIRLEAKPNMLFPSWPDVSRPPGHRRVYNAHGASTGREQAAATRLARTDCGRSVSHDALS